MRTVSRARTVRCGRDRIWSLVSDPFHLPRWWPMVTRVEDASPTAWTTVLRTPRGRTIRADFTRTEYAPPRRMAWRQELAQSPFERILAEAVTEIELDEEGPDETRVELRSLEQWRGRNRFGSFLARRAARRRLDEALDGLRRAVESA